MVSRGKPKSTPMNPSDVLDRFVRRALKIEKCSMVQSGEVAVLAEPESEIEITEGQGPVIYERVPTDEEKFEALAALLRPFTLESESVHLPKVILALRQSINLASVPEELQTRLAAISDWVQDHVIDKSSVIYGVEAIDPNGEPITGLMNNPLLAESWMYTDLVHTDPKHEKQQALSLDEADRYQAAVPTYCGIALEIVKLLNLTRDINSVQNLQIDVPDWDTPMASLEVPHEAVTIKLRQSPISNAYVFPAGTRPRPDTPPKNIPGAIPLTYTTLRRMSEPAGSANFLILDESEKVIESRPAFYEIKRDRLTIYVDDILKLCLPLPNSSDADESGDAAPWGFRPMIGSEASGPELMSVIKEPNHIGIPFVIDGSRRVYKATITDGLPILEDDGPDTIRCTLNPQEYSLDSIDFE